MTPGIRRSPDPSQPPGGGPSSSLLEGWAAETSDRRWPGSADLLIEGRSHRHVFSPKISGRKITTRHMTMGIKARHNGLILRYSYLLAFLSGKNWPARQIGNNCRAHSGIQTYYYYYFKLETNNWES